MIRLPDNDGESFGKIKVALDYNNAKEILTVKDIMKLLSCGRNTVLDMIHDGILDAHMVGKNTCS